MLRQMLVTQWKWARLELGVYAVIGFVIPTIVMKTMSYMAGARALTISINTLLSASVATGVGLGILAFLCAGSLAARPWIVDNAKEHALALSLPIAWRDYVRLRFVAGAALLLFPTVAVALGGMLAGLTLPIPETLHVYPVSIAVRFLGAALVMYSAIFAFQYVFGRNAARVAAGILVVVLLAEVVAQAIGLGSVVVRAWDLATSWPGPFEVIAARWMLIDA